MIAQVNESQPSTNRTNYKINMKWSTSFTTVTFHNDKILQKLRFHEQKKLRIHSVHIQLNDKLSMHDI